MRKFLMLLWLALLQTASVFAQKAYVIQSLDNLPIHINEYGKGKPVILLAGGPGFNAAYLRPICESLDSYRFIVPDQRGTGASATARVDSAMMRVSCYVSDLEVLRKHLKLEKIIIAGHSWGGMLALAYAAKYPAHVDRLILLGSGGITQNFFKYFGSNIRMRLHSDDLAESKNANNDFALHLSALWPGYFFDRERALATKALVDTNLAGHNSAAINSLTLRDYKMTEKARVQNLGRFKGPIYLIQGRQDPVGESTAFETKQILPQTQIFFIEKCGHLPWLESGNAAAEFFKLFKDSISG